MPESIVTAPDGTKLRVTHPEGASQDQIISYAKQNWKPSQAPAPSGPDLSAISPSGPGTPYPQGQQGPSEPRGIMERVGAGISQGFGESKVKPEEQAQYPLAGAVAKTVELPARLGGAVIGGAAGAGAGLAEKFGVNPADADRLMRDLGFLGQAAAVEGGTGPKTPSLTTQRRPSPPPAKIEPPAPPAPPLGPGAPPVVRPEQSQLLSGMQRQPYRETATDVQKALQSKRGEMQAATQAKYKTALEQEGEFAPGAMQGVGPKIRNAISQDPTMVLDKKLTPASWAAITTLDELPGFKPRKPPDPMAAITGKAEEVSDLKLSLRDIDVARRRLNTLYNAAKKDPTDKRTFGTIMEAFSDRVEHAIAEGLFSGDPKVLTMLRDARASHSREQRMFGEKRAPGDDAGLALRKIVEGKRTPEEIGNYLYGAAKIGESGRALRLLDMIQMALGKDHPTMGQIKKGAWDKALTRRNGVQELADSTISKKLFTPEELNLMRQYLVMKELPPKPKYTPPKIDEPLPPGVDPKREMAIKIGAFLASATVARFVPRIIRPVIKSQVKKQVEKFGQEPLERTVLERDARGRPTKTEPFSTKADEAILQTGLDSNIRRLQTEIRQVQYDLNLAKKRGEDITSEEFAGGRNKIKRLREQLKAAEGKTRYGGPI